MMKVGFFRKSQEYVQTFSNVLRVSSINQGQPDACFIIKQFTADNGVTKIEIPMNDSVLSFVED